VFHQGNVPQGIRCQKWSSCIKETAGCTNNLYQYLKSTLKVCLSLWGKLVLLHTQKHLNIPDANDVHVYASPIETKCIF